MVTKLFASASLIALVAVSEARLTHPEPAAAHPLVVRASVPLPFQPERGYLSFSSSWGDTHWRFAVRWSAGREHGRLAFLLASDSEGQPEG